MVVALWHRGAHRDGVGVRVFAVDGAGICAGLGYCGVYWRLLRAVYPPAAHTIDTAATHGAATAAAGHGDSATATRVSPHQWGLFDRGYALPGHSAEHWQSVPVVHGPPHPECRDLSVGARVGPRLPSAADLHDPRGGECALATACPPA